MKKGLGLILTGAMLLGSASFTGCTTSHPEVEMTLSFQNKTYVLEYKLYRNVAPITVEHFIALVEKGYYDGLAIHDFEMGEAMFTGGYKYEGNELHEVNYFETVKDWNLPQSVWADSTKTQPLYTVYGEFYEGNFLTVKNDPLTRTFGNMYMTYTDKGELDAPVYVRRSDGSYSANGQYKYNSATSLIGISLKSSSGTFSQYRIFGELQDKAPLQSLLDDVSEFEENKVKQDETYFFAESQYLGADLGDRYVASGDTIAYDVPNEPIVVESVKITKY